MCSSVSNSDPLSALNCDPDQPVILSFDFRLLDICKWVTRSTPISTPRRSPARRSTDSNITFTLRKLTEQIRTVHTGEIYLFSSIATEVVAGYLGKHPEAAKDPYEKLTDREKQVLKLIAEGHSHKEITGCVHATAGNDMKSAWTPRLTSGSLV